MTKITPLKKVDKTNYEKSKLHTALLKELKDDIKSHKVTLHKGQGELIAIYTIKNQKKVTIEVVVEIDSGEFIFVGVGDGTKGRASVASNPNGLKETVEEVVTVVKNHVKRNTFEKLKMNKADIKKLLQEEHEEIFDAQLEELQELKEIMLKNKDDLGKVLELNADGTIKLNDDELPILKVA